MRVTVLTAVPEKTTIQLLWFIQLVIEPHLGAETEIIHLIDFDLSGRRSCFVLKLLGKCISEKVLFMMSCCWY